VHDMAATHIIK